MYKVIQMIKALQVLLFHQTQQSFQRKALKYYEEFLINGT